MGEPTSCALRGRARHPQMQKPAQCKHKRERSRARRTVRCVPRAIMIARRAHRDRETRARERTPTLVCTGGKRQRRRYLAVGKGQ